MSCPVLGVAITLAVDDVVQGRKQLRANIGRFFARDIDLARVFRPAGQALEILDRRQDQPGLVPLGDRDRVPQGFGDDVA